MTATGLTGTRIRDRRLVQQLKQADLARSVGISASYLNLIEHNRRRIGGKLLMQIAAALKVTPTALSEGADVMLTRQLEALATQGVEVEGDRIDEFIGRFPGWAQMLSDQQERLTKMEARLQGLNDRLTHDPVLSQSMHDVLGAAAAIRSTASILIQNPDIDADWRGRFHGNIDAESRRLADTSAAMAAHFDALSNDQPGYSTPVEAVSAYLEQRAFHVAELETDDDISTLMDKETGFQTPGSVDLAEAFLAQYREDARMMPLEAFIRATEECEFDPLQLAAVFSVALPTVFRRIATLPRNPARPDIGFASCDAAGSLLLLKRPLGFAFRRSGDACRLWPLFEALRKPGMPLRETLISPEGKRFAAFAVAHQHSATTFNATPIFQASMVLISDPDGRYSDRPVAVDCPICGAGGCGAWRAPSNLQNEP
ncbi:MAG: helix-turn-helix domain-containing protein [Pseudomonadota bacterium]